MPKSKSTKSDTEFLPSVCVGFKETDPDTILFTEWIDSELNAEKWEPSKIKTPRKGDSQGSDSQEPTEYFDPQICPLPFSISAKRWVKPAVIFPNSTFVMYKEETFYSDFLAGSRHLFHSDFIRSFICSVGILEYLGLMNQWPIEGSGTNYYPNTGNLPWKPWHHIYSACKAGKGHIHKPQVNGLGKYVVRLFWLGCWRRVVVDDLIPIDKYNHILLPSVEKFDHDISTDSGEVETSKNKKLITKKRKSAEIRKIEMWPFILSKALLKLASITWTEFEELVDFDIIQALTGWAVQKIKTSELSANEIWEMCASYSDHYKWPIDSTLTPRSSKTATKSEKKSTKSRDEKKEETSREVQPYCLVASLADMRDIEEEDVPDIAPCWSHSFLIDQSRNIPLVKPEPQEELARWKRFRWVAWAIRKGIYRENKDHLIKCIKLVSNFRKCATHVVYSAPSKSALDMQQSAKVIDEMALAVGDKRSKKDSKSVISSEFGGKDLKSDKKSNKSAEPPQPPDPSIWGDFNLMSKYINFLHIYIKPSQFLTNIKITDLGEKTGKATKEVKSKKGDGQAKLIWQKDLQPFRNEPIYLFFDSVDYKYAFFNLSQAGCGDILLNSIVSSTSMMNEETRKRPISHMVIEKYNWQNNEFADMSVAINTFGNKSILLLLRPGRTMIRLWIYSTSSYVIYILSDVSTTIGPSEHVLEALQKESQLFSQYCYKLGSCFGQLVQAYGMPEYKQALYNFEISYKPNIKLKQSQIDIIDKEFKKQILNVILNKAPENRLIYISTLRVLFLDPTFGFRTTEYDYYDYEEFMEDIEEFKQQQKAAIKIQSFFRMLYVKRLISQHKQEDKSYFKNFEILKKIYKEIFNVETRISILGQIMRNILLLNYEMVEIRNYYEIYQELLSVIQYQSQMGTCQCSSAGWIPIFRYVFYVNSWEIERLKICLYCDISNYILRVFNNDNGIEIERYCNNVSTADYRPNTNGYTILGYGWTEEERKVNYKICIISIKKKSASLILFPPNNFSKTVVFDTYNPNVNNLICKCEINIMNDVICTFRLSTSFQDAIIKLKYFNDSGNSRDEIVGVGDVILPIANLKYTETDLKSATVEAPSISFKSKASIASARKKKRHFESASIRSSGSRRSRRSVTASSKELNGKLMTSYTIEAYVLYNSWPLTKEEWKNAQEVKKRNFIGDILYPELFQKSKRSILKKTPFEPKPLEKRNSVDVSTIRKPYWLLQAIYDKSEIININIDRKRDEEIKNIKRKWYEKDKRRYELSKTLREEYLKASYLKNSNSNLDVTETKSQNLGSKHYTSVISLNIEDFSSEFLNEEVETRTLIQPISKTKLLPPLEFELYAEEQYANKIFTFNQGLETDIVGKIKGLEDISEDLAKNTEKMIEFDERLENRRKIDRLTYERRRSENMKMQRWFDECRAESTILIETGYALRDKFIENMLKQEGENALTNTTSKAGKRKK